MNNQIAILTALLMAVNYLSFTLFFWFIMNQSDKVLKTLSKSTSVRNRRKKIVNNRTNVRSVVTAGSKRPYLWPYYLVKLMIVSRSNKKQNEQ